MSVFHNGELGVQKKLGVKESISTIGSKMIRDYMPEQHRDFYQAQPMMMLGVLDSHGYPWASPVLGEPGFIESPNDKTLIIHNRPLLESSNYLKLNIGDKIGLLGIELSTRRRNRINGAITSLKNNSLFIHVEQSFGNCPKYIQKRDVNLLSSHAPTHTFSEVSITEHNVGRIIQQADTFFIASRSGALTDNYNTGVDVSHRGGRPGFIKMTSSGDIVFPDFSGNNFFNTLGNIAEDSRVGLFIPDFKKGGGVWVSGQANILWDSNTWGHFEGAKRFISITPKAILLTPDGILQEQSEPELSPKLSHTSIWSELE